MFRKLLSLVLVLILFALPCLAEVVVDGDVAMDGDVIIEYGYDYSTPEEVGLYLHVFCELPPNFITKDEAEELGWDSREGNLWEVTDGLSIGGDKFGNREGLLPKAKDRQYYECDVNYTGGYRGGERIVFSDDGLIYYTDDHYESFDQLYDGWYEGETSPVSGDYEDYGEDYGYDDYALEETIGGLLGDLIGGWMG